MKNKKLLALIFVGIVLIVSVVALVVYYPKNQKSLLTAAVNDLGPSVLYAQFLDWSYDLIPGLSPAISARGTVTGSSRVRAYVQYSSSSAFSLSTSTRILIPSEFVSIANGNYSIDVPAENRLITLLPEKTYYLRVMVQDALGTTYSSPVKAITPENCMVEFVPDQVPYSTGGLRAGAQTIAAFTVKNNCSGDVKFTDAYFGVYGLSVSNPNIANDRVVSNVKVYSGSTLLSQPTRSWARYDFKNTVIPARGTKSFTIKADVPANVTQGDYLVTRIELGGTTPGTSNPQPASTVFVNTRGFAPSVTLGTRAVWQLKY